MFKKGEKRPKIIRVKRQRQELTLKQEEIVAVVADLCPSKLKPFLEAYAGVSQANAIKATCIQCFGFEDFKGITECKSEGCPLWRFRPYQKGKNDADD